MHPNIKVLKSVHNRACVASLDLLSRACVASLDLDCLYDKFITIWDIEYG